jgi:hypothetical protein
MGRIAKRQSARRRALMAMSAHSVQGEFSGRRSPETTAV